MYKLGHCVGGVWRQYSHSAVFSLERTQNNRPKLLATAPGSDPNVFLKLVGQLNTPLLLLYVLHTPRIEQRAGRYQSGGMEYGAFSEFYDRFKQLFQSDSRFDLWIHSPADQATIVWDRHDLIHVYGIVDAAIVALRTLGFRHGSPAIDFVHEHHYHHENDEQAAQLLLARDWTWSPLHGEDEQ